MRKRRCGKPLELVVDSSTSFKSLVMACHPSQVHSYSYHSLLCARDLSSIGYLQRCHVALPSTCPLPSIATECAVPVTPSTCCIAFVQRVWHKSRAPTENRSYSKSRVSSGACSSVLLGRSSAQLAVASANCNECYRRFVDTAWIHPSRNCLPQPNFIRFRTFGVPMLVATIP